MLCSVTCVWLWNPLAACQAPLSMRFSSQEYWVEWVAIPSRGDILEPQIELASPALQADSLPLSHLGSPLFLMLICKTDRGRMKITRKHCSLNDNITTHHNLLWLNTWSIQQVNTSLNKILITKPWNRPTAIARPEYIEILLLLLSRFSPVRLCVTP